MAFGTLPHPEEAALAAVSKDAKHSFQSLILIPHPEEAAPAAVSKDAKHSFQSLIRHHDEALQHVLRPAAVDGTSRQVDAAAQILGTSGDDE
jgi:hypothetical protein